MRKVFPKSTILSNSVTSNSLHQALRPNATSINMKLLHPSLSLLLTATFTLLTHSFSFFCTESSYIQDQRPLSQNCAKALLTTASSSSEIGEFHHDGANDIYRLPETVSYGDCDITVDIASGPYNSSWMKIWMMASTLNEACVDYTAVAGRVTTKTGGWFTRGVLITMGKSSGVGLENRTGVAVG